MKTERIEEILNAYFPASTFSCEVRDLARQVAKNVERETRQEAVSQAYDLANRLAINK